MNERNRLHERHIGRTSVEISGEFDTLEQVADARRDYLGRYMPEGYGTFLLTTATADGYAITGQRSASCE